MPSRYRIAFYVRQDGSCPVEDYLLADTNDKDLVVIINVIHRLAFVGQALIDTDMVKRLGDPIWELRKGYHRIFYAHDWTFDGFIMLSAFWKESRHTPRGEINRAHRHWQDYLQHHKVKEYDIPLDEKLINL